MKRVDVFRGVPGSGKTRLAEARVAALNFNASTCVVSADDFFTNAQSGDYVYDPTKVHLAHQQCFRNFLRRMGYKMGQFSYPHTSYVAVDNTNLTAWEVSPYLLCAEAHGYEVMIVNVECDVELALRRNVHGVAPETHRAMVQRYYGERLPAWWPQETMRGDAPDAELRS